MDAAGKSFDVELFIEEVKKYPEIWDTTCEEYHDKIKKRSSWCLICEKFCEGFREKPEKEKNEIGKRFMCRWKNIKDNFIRREKMQTKSGQGADWGRRYIYARQLSFLQNSFTPGPTHTSLEDEDNVVNEKLDNITQTITSANDTTTPSTHQSLLNLDKEPAAKRRKIIEKGLINFLNTPIPTVTSTPEQDDDRSFFESLIPAVKTFTMDQKLEFRCEVMKLVKRFRTSSAQPHCTTFPCSHQQPPAMHHTQDSFSATPTGSNNFQSHQSTSASFAPTHPQRATPLPRPTYLISATSPYSSTSTGTDNEDSLEIFTLQ